MSHFDPEVFMSKPNGDHFFALRKGELIPLARHLQIDVMRSMPRYHIQQMIALRLAEMNVFGSTELNRMLEILKFETRIQREITIGLRRERTEREEKERQERLEREEKERQERLAREEKERQERLAREEKQRQERLEKERLASQHELKNKDKLLSGSSEAIYVLQYVSDFRTKPFGAYELDRVNLRSSEESMEKKNHLDAVEFSLKPVQKVLDLLPVPGNPLNSKFFRPYVIQKKLSDINFEKITPDRRKQTQLFLVNMRKPYVGRSSEPV